MIDAGAEVVVRNLGFNLPCRQFIIGAQVTRDKRMPMVDEFVLRTLRLCERMSTRRLKGFFGFTELEAQVVLADLRARSLVVIDEDRVSLHASALEMFRTSPHGFPQIVEVEGWVNRLWFDLITKTMVSSPNLRQARSHIELKRQPGEEDIEAGFAKEAFQANFRDYLRDVRKINNPDHLSLYAVTSVDPGRFSFAQLTAKQSLKLDPQPKIDLDLAFSGSAYPSKLRKLTDAVTSALQTHTDPPSSLAARTEFARLCGIDAPSISNEIIDLRRWVAEEALAQSEELQPFIGCSYLERNRKSFTNTIERSEETAKLTDADLVEVLWLRPGGALWGTSEDVRNFVSELRTSIRKRSGHNPAINVVLVIPSALQPSQRDQRRRFAATFDQGWLSPAGLISTGVEVLLVRGLSAVISTLVPLSGSTDVWVGRITSREADLDRLEKRVGWTAKGDRWTSVWNRRAGEIVSDETSE